MWNWRKTATMISLCGLAICVSRAQEGTRAIVDDRDAEPSVSSGQGPSANSEDAHSKSTSDKTSQHKRVRKTEWTLSADERLAVIASALDSKTPHFAERDCSHLVHAIYQRAGFPYAYKSSDDLYDGVQGFQRVSQPQSGDVVVWPGHAGIVIRPSRHIFFSFLRSGPGTDDYRSRYWRSRGEPRFYRYVKHTACAGCTLARGRAGQ
jgi:hypothetical protein